MSYPQWFPDDQHGYSIALCRCADGPYLGARKMGTPCCCERCGFMTQDQWDALLEWLAEQVHRPGCGVPTERTWACGCPTRLTLFRITPPATNQEAR